MASERAIALMRANAMGRIEKSASTLAKHLEGVKGFDAPLASIRGYGDIELAHAKQLEAVAGVLETIVDAVKKPDSEPVEQLEENYADAQTQLLAAHKGEKAVPADDLKDQSQGQGQGQSKGAKGK